MYRRRSSPVAGMASWEVPGLPSLRSYNVAISTVQRGRFDAWAVHPVSNNLYFSDMG
jgi:hypothetical protein